tara:strand:- start:114892 stop:115341 length:450 start_codon:yes stop_codon:yes gene_type:complete
MLQAIVKRKIMAVFDCLSSGDYESVLADVGKTVEHRFAGDHCLDGTRTSVESMRLWFQRLYRLFPNLSFEIHSISVAGWPWNMTVAVEWTDHATPIDGIEYVNYGTRIIRLVFGKVVSLHAYLDIQLLINALNRMADSGYEEAAKPPIL